MIALAKGRSPAELGALAGAYFHGSPAPPSAAAFTDASAAPSTASLDKDAVKATKLWVAAARKGDPASMFHVALCLIDGTGALPQDRPRAEQLLTKLADGAGHNWSCFVLGTLLLAQVSEAAGVPAAARAGNSLSIDPARIPPESRRHADCDRAFGYLLRAAQANVQPAWLNVGNCYAHGVGTKPDDRQAVVWLQKAALAGDPLAGVMMASRYASGTGGAPREARMAARLWRSAAEAGHPLAAHNVGVAYLQPGGATAAPGASPAPVAAEGGSGGVDYAAALVWFVRAGEAGFVRSQVNAGAIYASGAPGVPRNPEAARVWLGRARDSVQAALDSSHTPPGVGPAGDARRAQLFREQLADIDARIAAIDAPPAIDSSGESKPRLASEPQPNANSLPDDADSLGAGATTGSPVGTNGRQLSPGSLLAQSTKSTGPTAGVGDGGSDTTGKGKSTS